MRGGARRRKRRWFEGSGVGTRSGGVISECMTVGRRGGGGAGMCPISPGASSVMGV